MTRRILVTFYSLSGHTRDIAHEIARALQADVEPIRDLKPRRGATGVLRAVIDGSLRRETAIEPVEKLPMDYDLLVLGGPVWAGRMASPVRTYARRHGAGARNVAFFCTLGGRGAGKAMEELARLCHATPSATLVVDAKHLAQPEHAAEMSRFIASLGLPDTPARRRPAASPGLHATSG